MNLPDVLFLVALAAAQTSPDLPQKAPKPALPKIDKNACPFEGCKFGRWTVREPARLYSNWEPDRKILRTLRPREVVTALTGIHITFEPLELRVTAPIPQYGLKKDDLVFGYMRLGEGFMKAWFNGYWVAEFDASSFDAVGCSRNCKGTLVKSGRVEWWVQIKTKDGTIGWTDSAQNFDGKDSLAGPSD